MEHFNFNTPTEVFAIPRRGPKGQPMVYRKFPTGAEAVRHAMEVLDADTLKNAIMENDEARLGATGIEALYRSPDYPLVRGKPY
jgi:hypothetical protein